MCVVCETTQDSRAATCRRCGMQKPTPEALRIYNERQLEATRRDRGSSFYDSIDPVAEMHDAYDAYYYGS